VRKIYEMVHSGGEISVLHCELLFIKTSKNVILSVFSTILNLMESTQWQLNKPYRLLNLMQLKRM